MSSVEPSVIEADVAIVGAGPVGLAAAALLAQRGHRVVVLERQPSKYGLPRAGHIDHEVARILQGLGALQPILDDAPDPDPYTWYNSEGRVLLSFPFGEQSVSGYQSDFMIFQPVLDDTLFDVLDRYPDEADLRLGSEVIALTQSESRVDLTVVGTARGSEGVRYRTGTQETVRARYVIAADGAGSTVRAMLGVGRTGLDVDERWYTVDCTIKAPLPAGINGQWCDPSRPTYVGPLGRHHHRFEMKLLPGELEEDFDEARTWQILEKWGVTPEHLEFYRRITYRFEAQEADRWSVGRVFLAGDAAHTMPPYMGQGLCSGVRDSASLAWKLDLVLRGLADAALLDTYESERKPHTRRWREITMAVGAVSAELDPVRAARRDEQFLAGTHASLPGPPSIGVGAFRDQVRGVVMEPAGTLFLQAPVSFRGRSGLFHDVVDGGTVVLLRSGDDERQVSDEQRAFISGIGGVVVSLGELGDPEGAYAGYLDGMNARAVLVRPDYYVFGSAVEVTDIGRLIDDFQAALAGSLHGKESA